MGRDAVLAAVRTALTGVVQPALATLEPAAAPDARSLAARFTAEARAVGTVVHDARTAAEATGIVAEVLAAAGAKRVCAWPTPLARDVAAGAVRGDTTIALDVVDGATPTDTVADADVGVTEADALIAASGTLVLTAAGRPRTVSLLPPVHVAVAPVTRLVPDLGAALRLVRGDTRPDTCITLVTGPSRTADIEKKLVVGVHGPCALHVVLLAEP